MIGAAIGCALGATFGSKSFGWIGAIIGGAVGLYVGLVLGRVPYYITFALMRRELKKCDTATLKSKLEPEYFISIYIIAELVVRGEPVEQFKDYVIGLSHSACSHRQRIGKENMRIWFPELAQNSEKKS